MVPLLIQIRYGGAAAVEGEVDLKNACQLSSSTMPPSSRRHFEQRAANKACRRRETQQRGGNPHKTVTIQLFNGLPLVKYQSSHISHFCPSYISIDLYILASPHIVNKTCNACSKRDQKDQHQEFDFDFSFSTLDTF